MSWNKNTTEKMANLALSKGIDHSMTKGQLNKYVSSLWFKHRKANNIRIYGQDVYLFAGDTLITLFRIPTKLAKCIKYNS